MHSSHPNHCEAFLREAEDLLVDIEQTTLRLETTPATSEDVNRLFRAFHTLKGSGSMFGFDAIAAFTHHVESVLDRVRAGNLSLSAELRHLLLAAHDHLASHLAPGRTAATTSPLSSDGAAIAQEFIRLLGGAPDQPSAPQNASGESSATPRHFRVRFRPPRELLIHGTNPLALLNELRSFGNVRLATDDSALPPLSEFDPTTWHLAWNIELTTPRDVTAVRNVFIFVEDLSELSIEETSAKAHPINAPGAASTPPPEPNPAVRASRKDSAVRVPSERLDRLVALVGELVINRSRLAQATALNPSGETEAAMEELDRLVGELRDSVLGIRMMPIGATFARFNRLVHDLSAELGKDVRLVTEGADTELDKSVLDQLGDPLVHLIRNSLDHGIEVPADRAARGKSPCGTLRLAARHTGSNVVITIADDGRGLDTAAIRAQAVARHLIAPDADIEEEAIHQLIFLPGFSTARAITNVSGRGVGLDVVRRQIESLRGTVTLDSAPDRGTAISLTLPLTLAIIDGLLVELAGDRFIIPLASVQETVELSAEEQSRHRSRQALALRGELIPFLRLRELFAVTSPPSPLEKIVIVRHGHDLLGLVVDRVLGGHQTVIQSLGRFYRDIGIVSGSTIMGDGRVALILDPGALARTTA